MNVKKVFIDGEAGTTGLQVRERLAKRDDLQILSIDDDKRKDENERKRLINEADAVILCTLGRVLLCVLFERRMDSVRTASYGIYLDLPCFIARFSCVVARPCTHAPLFCSWWVPLLCTAHAGLPDAASIEAASWVEPDNDRTVLIDASTAFRVDKDWVYGFPGALPQPQPRQ